MLAPVDPRTPVIVGAGQLNNRTDDGDPEREPVELLAAALRLAADDAKAPGILAAADSVRVVAILSWRYRDAAALVAERVGAAPPHTLYTAMGGNSPQVLLNRTFLDVAAGRADVVLVGGAEAWRTRMDHRGTGGRPAWTPFEDGPGPTEVLGEELTMSAPGELALGIGLPVQMYPIFETALRAASGRSPAEHQQYIATLWSRFSAVAAGNPNAWIRRSFTADEIVTPGPGNRMVGYPYPKLMNANNAVEQAAGLVVCSVEAAERFGVPRERWVFPLSGTDAADTPFVTNRVDLVSSPAIRVAGARALTLAGIGIGDIGHTDLYSCFPSAVEVAAAELGVPLDGPADPPTVTGGLSFAGGPWNNYVTHAVATMVDVLRADEGGVGLCSANGGFLTKHAFGLYASRPPVGGFRWEPVQAEVDRSVTPLAAAADGYQGQATIEGYTVMHDRDGHPERAFAAVLVPGTEPARAWAASNDADTCAELLAHEGVGRVVTVDGEATLRL